MDLFELDLKEKLIIKIIYSIALGLSTMHSENKYHGNLIPS